LGLKEARTTKEKNLTISSNYHFTEKYSSGQSFLSFQLPLASAEGNAGAEVLISDNGDMVYVSSRGVGVIVVYRYRWEVGIVDCLQVKWW
jgi:hypothetical protein